MKKNIIFTISLLSVIILFIGIEKLFYSYENYINTYKSISAKQFINKYSSREHFLYIGRKTCPHCKKFVPKLTVASKNEKIEIFYIDSDKYRKDKHFQSLVNKFDVKFVPYLARINSGEVKEVLNITDDTSTSEIKKFLSKH